MDEKWLAYTRRYEGLNIFPYQCPTGHMTIGYGHNLGNGISKEAAEFILQQDMQAAQRAVSRRFEWFAKLDRARQFVLVDMCFNMGLASLCTFKKFLAALRHRDFICASEQMLNSRWAGQVGRRARELAEMMKTGEYL